MSKFLQECNLLPPNTTMMVSNMYFVPSLPFSEDLLSIGFRISTVNQGGILPSMK